MALVTEDLVEIQTIDWFKDIGYQYLCGYDIAHDGDTPERNDYRSVILKKILESALHRINPDIPKSSIDHALSQLLNPNIPALMSSNRQVHHWLTKGIKVEFEQDGQQIGKQLKVIDFDDPLNNDWLVVNQFTVEGIKHNRRPDLVVFVNGLPLSVIELKNAADENADIWSAFNQLQTYKQQIAGLFRSNALLVTSDGIAARVGSLSADLERFMPWRTIDGTQILPKGQPELPTLIEGVFEPRRFLDLLRWFTAFGETGDGLVKIIAGYHQYHAVNLALASTIRATFSGQAEDPAHYGLPSVREQPRGDRKAGVIWHTQGSGKSLTMVFLIKKLRSVQELNDYKVIIVNDRNDLEVQLGKTANYTGEKVDYISRIEELKPKLSSEASNITMVMLQKFQEKEKN